MSADAAKDSPKSRLSPARSMAIRVLLSRRRQGEHIEEALRGAVGVSSLSSADRALATEIVLGTTKRLGTLGHLVTRISGVSKRRIKRSVFMNLQAGFYQVLCLERVPAFAAINETVEIAKRFGAGAGRFTNAVMRKLVRLVEASEQSDPAASDARTLPLGDGRCVRFGEDVFVDPDENLAEHLSQVWSLPTWLVARWVKRLGLRQTRSIARCVNERPPVTLRIEQALMSRDALVRRLAESDFTFEETERSDAVVLRRGGELGEIASLEGVFVQDLSSMEVVDALDVGTGDRVLDLCAAPGVKTAQIAGRLGDGGTLVAADINDGRSARLSENLAKAAFDRAQIVCVDGRTIADEVTGRFDRVLVDAPCSNTGVLRRRTEARWRVNARSIESLGVLQSELLAAGFSVLAEGGRLVYSTCSIEREENEGVVEAFVDETPEAALVTQKNSLPQPGGPDGGYFAVIERTGLG